MILYGLLPKADNGKWIPDDNEDLLFILWHSIIGSSTQEISVNAASET
jgi:hypothetical protein